MSTDQQRDEPRYEAPVEVLPWARVVLENNPGPMTLDGTNTWLIGTDRVVVVDPGEDDEAHLRAVVEAAGGPERVVGTVVTHFHHDHSGGARRFHDLTGAPVRAIDPAHRHGGEGLVDGEVIDAGDIALRVMATPGHTADSLCLVADGAVLTGDTVLGRGTTVVTWPEGNLGDYLRSLHRLTELSDLMVLPGHGPALPSSTRIAQAYLDHRQERLDQVRAVLASSDHPTATAGETAPYAGRAAAVDDDHAGRAAGSDDDIVALVERVVERVYADVDRAVWPAARMSVRAQLDYLRISG